MSEEKQLRLGQVARKLNVGRNTIISYLQDKGYEIDSNPNTKIDDSLFRILENAFEDSAVEKKVASNIKIGLEEKSNISSEFKNTIKEEKKEITPKKEDTEKKEEPKKEEGGIKIIKKIKLDPNDNKRVASSGTHISSHTRNFVVISVSWSLRFSSSSWNGKTTSST